VGVTTEGSTFSFSREIERLRVEEDPDPVRIITTQTGATAAFAFAQLDMNAWRYAMNAAASAWSGTPNDTTGAAILDAPGPEDEVPCQLLWMNNDNTEWILFWQCRQTGTVERTNRRVAISSFPVTFEAEKPASTVATSLWRVGATGASYDATP
jgi:hypothetical protein